MAATATPKEADMRCPDWFKAQVVEAVTLHGLSYTRASHLYDVADETIRKWVNGASDAPVGLGRLEAMEHRVARIEHYLALAEAVLHENRNGSQHLQPVVHRNGHNGFGAVPSFSHVALPAHGGTGS
jgi:transposase-like protein